MAVRLATGRLTLVALLAAVPLAGCPVVNVGVTNIPDGAIGSDAGEDAGSPIGASCTVTTTTTGASNCNAGLSCVAIAGTSPSVSQCTSACSTNSECGSNAAAPNVCVQGTCFEGCTGADGGCRSGETCMPYGTFDSFCAPSCAKQPASYCEAFIGYPFLSCDTDAGACQTAGSECSGAAAACASGQVCYADSQASESFCVDDCTLGSTTTCSSDSDCASGSCSDGVCTTCPNGWECFTGDGGVSDGGTGTDAGADDDAGNSGDGGSDAGTTDAGVSTSPTIGSCQPVPSANYGVCYSAVQCPAGVDCVIFQSGQPGLCLPACSGSGAGSCPSGPSGITGTVECELPLNSGTACIIDCTPPSGSLLEGSCPSGTTCTGPYTFTVGGAKVDLCVP